LYVCVTHPCGLETHPLIFIFLSIKKIVSEQNAFKIRYLKDEYKRIALRLSDKKNALEQINKRLNQKTESIKLHKDKINKIKETIKISEKIANTKINNQSTSTRWSIVQYQKERLKELNKYVFNLVEIKPKL
jgi:hypothetical protein